MNNGQLGWPGSKKALYKLCATNELMSRQFWTASTTWVVPVGVIRVRASALGGGGGGGGTRASIYDALGGGGGGGGGLFVRGWLNVRAGETLTITVGVGGAGGGGASNGGVGQASTIIQAGGAVISAAGGNFGTFGTAPAYGQSGAEQSGFYFAGIPVIVVNGKAGASGLGGKGGGGGGLSAQNTEGGFGGLGSLGSMIPPGGFAPPLGTPESGSGGAAGTAGARGSGGSGAALDAGVGGAGGSGFVMVEY